MFARYIFVPAFLFLSTSAFALTEVGGAELCRTVFGGSGWRMSRDDEVERSVREFTEQARKPATPVVCSGTSPLPYLAGGRYAYRGFETYFVIAIDGDLRLELMSDIRGIVAHEVAHATTDGESDCASRIVGGRRESYLECEHHADKEGERLAGRGQVARSLRSIIDYLRHSRPSDGHTQMIISDFERRIFLLR